MPVVYEQIFTIQEAINKACATKQVVRFLSRESNEVLRKGIVDKKGCKLMKKDKDSNDVAVVPPNVEDFDFEDVDTKVSTSLWVPDGRIIR